MRGVFALLRQQLFLDMRVPMGREPGSVQRQSLKLPYAVEYRTNVCRRRLASDLARTSESTSAQGLTRITMSGSPVPPRRRLFNAPPYLDRPQ
jgi:hypothetical protein